MAIVSNFSDNIFIVQGFLQPIFTQKTLLKPGKINHFRNLVTVAEIRNIGQNIHRNVGHWTSEVERTLLPLIFGPLIYRTL